MRKLSFSSVLFLAATLLQIALPSVYGLHIRHASVDIVEESPIPGGCHSQEPNFKAPHHCGSAIQECEFTLKWKELDGSKVEYDLVATVAGNASVWAAVGFSGDSKMGDTDVVVCWIDDQGSSSIKHGWIIKDKYDIKLSEKETSKESLTLVSMNLEDDLLECKFSRTKAPIDSLLGKPLNTSWYVLVASGPLTTTQGSTLRMRQHHVKYASDCKCDVTDCKQDCSCPSSFRYQLLKLHGVIMCVTFIFFIPAGALLARYYKMAFINTWFKGHVTMMVIGVLWSLVGLALILGHTRGKFEVGGHQLTGVTCISLGVIQPFVALFRPPKQPTVKRVLFNAFHRTVAVSVLILSIIALFWGSYLYHNSVMPWMMATLGLTVLTNLAFILLLEILTRTHKFSTAPPVGYHKVTKQDELSESEEEVFVRDDPAKKTKSGSKKKNQEADSKLFHMEKGLLMLFVIQSFCFAILVSGLIFYYDSLHHH